MTTTKDATLQAIGALVAEPAAWLGNRDALLMIADCIRDIDDAELRRTVRYILEKVDVPAERMDPR